MEAVILGSVYYGAEPPGIPLDRPYGLRAVAQKNSLGSGQMLCPQCGQPGEGHTRSARMARQPRLVLPGVAIHVIQRGNNRGSCFRAARDQALYLSFLREFSTKFETLVHAYCLMPNHVHLLMTPPSGEACAAMMRDLGQRYVRHFNRRHGRTGTLWEGRFRSCVTDSAHYVLACYRYIELNPVRAGIAQGPEHYEWSSHAINIGRRSDGLITPHVEFLALGNNTDARQRAYAGLFEEALQPSIVGAIRKATNAGHRLGSEHLP